MIRSKKLREGGRGLSCVACGKSNETIVGAHYTGLRSQSFGKGTGIKPHDLCIADLCHKCHEAFDQGLVVTSWDDPFMRKIDLSEQFLYYCMLTLIRRVEQGTLTTTDMREK